MIKNWKRGVFRPDIEKSTIHVLGSYLLHYLTQTSWALFWKGVGNVSENTTLGLSLRIKFRFSPSMGSVINVWSAANAHSDIFFFKSLLDAIVPNWNKKVINKTISCKSYCLMYTMTRWWCHRRKHHGSEYMNILETSGYIFFKSLL